MKKYYVVFSTYSEEDFIKMANSYWCTDRINKLVKRGKDYCFEDINGNHYAQYKGKIRIKGGRYQYCIENSLTKIF